MKKTLTLFLLLCMNVVIYAGDSDTLRGWYAGITFNHLNVIQNQTSYTSKSFIDGIGQDIFNMSSTEIDEINKYINIKSKWSIVGINIGTNLLKNSSSNFTISADLCVGYPIFEHMEEQDFDDYVFLKARQTGFNFFGHIGIHLKYRLNRWTISAVPSFEYLHINSNDIRYNYLQPGTYNDNYKYRNFVYYPKLDILAGFSFSTLQLFAGPGFYYYFSDVEFDISKTSQNQLFKDEIKQEYESVENLYGTIGLNWNFCNRFNLRSFINVGTQNTYLSTSINYQF